MTTTQELIDSLPSSITPNVTTDHDVDSENYKQILQAHEDLHQALPVLIAPGGLDDTAAIQAVITAVPAGTRLLFSANDDFLVSNLLDHGKRVIFDGQGATITTTSHGGSPFVLTGVGSEVHGFTIDCTAQPDHHGIEADGVADIVISKVTILNAAEWGIVASECDNIKIRDFYIKDSGNAGVFLTASALHRNYEVSTGTVDRRGVTGSEGGGIILRGVAPGDVGFIQAAKIHHVWVYLPIEDHGVGVEVTWCPFAQLNEVYAEGGGIGVSIAQSPNSKADGISINAATSIGLEIAGSPACTVTTPVIDGQLTTVTGLAFNGDGDLAPVGCTVTGPVIRHCTGFSIDGHNAAELSITGGRILNGGTGNSVVNLVNAHNSAIAGLIINGNGTGKNGVFMDTTNNVSITGCPIFGHTDEPVYYYAGSAYTVTVGIVASNSFVLNGSTTPGVAGAVTIGPGVVWGPNSAI